MKYCFRCGNSFTTKSNLNKHLRKKKQCHPFFLKIERNEIINRYDDYLLQYISVLNEKQPTGTNQWNGKSTKIDIKNLLIDENNYEKNINKTLIIDEYTVQPTENQPITNQSIQKPTKNQPITNQENGIPTGIQKIGNPFVEKGDDMIKKIKCEYCESKFSHKNSYYRHKKHRCIIIKKNEKEKSELIDKLLNEKYNSLKSKLEKKMEKTIKNKLESNTPNQINNEQHINNGNINNGHIGDQIFIINNYGEEKIKEITAKECEMIMSHEFNMITKLIEYIYIIPPENRNAFIPSLKEKY